MNAVPNIVQVRLSCTQIELYPISLHWHELLVKYGRRETTYQNHLTIADETKV